MRRMVLPRIMSSTILCPWSGRKGISAMSPQPSAFLRCFSCNIVSMIEYISTSPPKWSDSVKVHPAGPKPVSGAGGISLVTFRKCTKWVLEANSLAISSTLTWFVTYDKRSMAQKGLKCFDDLYICIYMPCITWWTHSKHSQFYEAWFMVSWYGQPSWPHNAFCMKSKQANTHSSNTALFWGEDA